MSVKLMLATVSVASFLFAGIPDPVKVDGGQISGIAGQDAAVRVFKGIPYAKPPVGDLRWRAPQPVAAWQGVRKAEQFSASCIQLVVEERKPWTYEFMTHTPLSEDCLYLNIWTSAANAGEKRPVVFWMHGGGLNEGATAVPVYDGENLAKKGVVVVSINYRLNLYGFFAHPELTKESGKNASGNYGFQDQVAALQWVQRNIANFGGDPAKVTVMGQSAGAGSVLALLTTPLSKGLFARAITESGSRLGRPAAKLADVEADGVKYAALKKAASLKALRAMSDKDLTAAGTRTDNFRWGATIDGYYLLASVDDTIAQGKHHDVPLLAGSNADEGSSAADYAQIKPEVWAKQARERFGPKADAYAKLYPVATPAEAAITQKQSPRDEYLTSTYVFMARRLKSTKSKIYTYYWTHAEPGPDSARYGAFHTSEVPYVFNSLSQSKRPWTEQDRKIADTMSSYWANFISTGDPNGKGLPVWPAFDLGAKRVMELGEKFGPRPIADPAKFDFWEQYFNQPMHP